MVTGHAMRAWTFEVREADGDAVVLGILLTAADGRPASTPQVYGAGEHTPSIGAQAAQGRVAYDP